jgi:hypothetical protein
LIPVIAIGRGLEPLDARTNLLTRLNWWWKKKLNDSPGSSQGPTSNS